MTEMKEVVVTYGPPWNEQTVRVQLNGVAPEDRLTPRLARAACIVAHGFPSGIVTDGARAYRVTSSGARKIKTTDWPEEGQ